MAQAMEEMLAVPDKRAAKLAGISMRQLRYWEGIGLVVPSVRGQISPRNTVRLYSYQDLLELLQKLNCQDFDDVGVARRVVVTGLAGGATAEV